MYFYGIEDKIIKEQFKLEGEFEIEHRLADKIGKTVIDICFCSDNRALWICKYKKKYYGNMIKNIEVADKYSLIDVFYSLRENAIKTLKFLK